MFCISFYMYFFSPLLHRLIYKRDKTFFFSDCEIDDLIILNELLHDQLLKEESQGLRERIYP